LMMVNYTNLSELSYATYHPLDFIIYDQNLNSFEVKTRLKVGFT